MSRNTSLGLRRAVQGLRGGRYVRDSGRRDMPSQAIRHSARLGTTRHLPLATVQTIRSVKATHLGTPQYPPTFPNNRLKSLETTPLLEDKTQIPHEFIPIISSSFTSDQAWKSHHPILRPPFSFFMTNIFFLIFFISGRE